MSVTDAPLHRLTYDDVMAMVEAGILHEDDRVELSEYWVVDGPGRRLIQHLDPTADSYARVMAHEGEATVQAQAGGEPLELSRLFG